MIHDCLGCRLANKLDPTHIVFEDDLITCFLDIAPLNEGHVMILPKKHYIDVEELDVEIATAIMVAAAKISKALKVVFKPNGISAIQNGGKFNDLSHYHMHVFPRYEGDGFAWVEPEDVKDAKSRLDETNRKIVDAMKHIQKYTREVSMTEDFYCEEVLSGRTSVNKVFETDNVLAYHHTRRYYPVHIVVIPKRHIASLITLEDSDNNLLLELLGVVKRVAADVTIEHGACRVLTNLGKYQDSKHLHWHIAFGDPVR